MQMIFQDPYSSLNPRMTVLEIIGEGLYLQGGFTHADIKEKVADWLRRVGLQPDHMSRYCHEFSGGQRQRIGIARALVLNPKFVVCDEPISALDVSVQAQVVNLLGEFRDTLGISLLFIAHDLSMVRYVSDRIIVMYLGALVEIGKADDVFFHPLHPYTRLLIASNPEADPEYERKHAHVPIKGEIPSPINVPPECRFAGRCPDVMKHCHRVTPEVIKKSDSQGVACLLYA
jgi:oligopeptide/dipeptide ABC transporter ATP-binding protein